MTNSCCSRTECETLIFTCAGAAYSGQVANRAGVQLMEQGCGNLFCIAAVAAGISEKIERARQAARRVAIDGCEDRCVLKTLEKAGLTADVHVVLTEMGIAKKPAQPSMISDGKSVVDAVKLRLGQRSAGSRCCG
jgi:uncharacterized metal-binding protein